MQTRLTYNRWTIFYLPHTGFSPKVFGKWYSPQWACAGQYMYHFLPFLENNGFQPIRELWMIQSYHVYKRVTMKFVIPR